MGRLWVALVAAIVLLSSVPFLGTLDNPLIWDSHSTVVDDPAIRSLANVPGFFVENSLPTGDGPARLAYWRPLAKTVLALEYAAFGEEPAGYHAVSVLLGMLTVALLAGVLGRGPPGLAALVLFAASPARGEAIAWVYGQSTLLCAVFVLAALWAWHRGRDGWAAVATVAALLCRETAIVLPLVLAAHLVWVAHDRRPVRLVAPGALALAYLGVRTAVVGSPPLTTLDPASWVTTAPSVVATAARTAIWPAGAVAFHPLDVGTHGLAALAGVAIVVAVGVGIALRWREDGALAFWLAWTVLWLLPWLNVGGFADFRFTEKAALLPAIGVAVLAVRALWPTAVGRAALVVVALAHGGLTTWRTTHWSDEPTFLAAVVATTPDYAPPVFLLAVEHAKAGRYAEAAPLFQRAAELRPEKSAKAWLNLGNCRDAMGDLAGATSAWERALVAEAEYPPALLSLARAAERRRDAPGAVGWYRRFLAAEPAPPPDVRRRVEQLEAMLRRQ